MSATLEITQSLDAALDESPGVSVSAEEAKPKRRTLKAEKKLDGLMVLPEVDLPLEGDCPGGRFIFVRERDQALRLLDYWGSKQCWAALDYETGPAWRWRVDTESGEKIRAYQSGAKGFSDPYTSDLLLASISVNPGEAVVMDMRHLIGLPQFNDAFRYFLDNCKLVAHQILFEQTYNWQNFGTIGQTGMCTMIAHQVANAGRGYGDGLNDVTYRLIGVELDKFWQTQFLNIHPTSPLAPGMISYSAGDVCTLLAVAQKLEAELRTEDLWHIWAEFEYPLIPIIAEAVIRGFAVSEEKLNNLGVYLSNLAAERREEFAKIWGEVNPNSPKQVLEWLQQHGLPDIKSTSKPVLDKIQKKEPDSVVGSAISSLLDVREAEKADGTYRIPYQERYINPVTRRVHPGIRQAKTATGRMAASDPNCFDAETEVLTKSGWVKIPDLMEDQEVAEWHDGAIRFVRPNFLVEKEFSGDLVSLENAHIDLLLTPEHRCLLRNRKNLLLKVVRADAYQEDYHQIHSGTYNDGSLHMDAELVTLLCAIQADGHIERCGGISFVFREQRKVERLIAALETLDIPFNFRNRKKCGLDCTIIYIGAGAVRSNLSHLLGPGKTFLPWMLNFTTDTRNCFLQEIRQWDGCVSDHGIAYSSNNRANADLVQALFAMSGQRAKIRAYIPRAGANINWQLDVTNKDYSQTTNISKKRIPYTGKVYCLSVPSSYVLVRRNGKTAVTGQCQNIPSRTELGSKIRGIVVAPPGYLFGSADYSQFEVRALAALSGEQSMIKIYQERHEILSELRAYGTERQLPHPSDIDKMREDKPDDYGELIKDHPLVGTLMDRLADCDFHRRMASILFGVPTSEVTHSQRGIAKTINFLVPYGGGPGTLAEKAGVSIDEAKDVLDRYFKKNRAAKQYLDYCAAQALNQGWTATPAGRKRFYPSPNQAAIYQELLLQKEKRPDDWEKTCDTWRSHDPMQIANKKAAFRRSEIGREGANQPIQGVNADATKKASILAAPRLKHLDPTCGIVLWVHDEIDYESPEQKAWDAFYVLEECMIQAAQPYLGVVPVEVGVSIATYWAK